MTKRKRHKWKQKAQRTRQCEHCGWRERWKFVGKNQVCCVWYERGEERQDHLPQCAPVGQDNVARGAAAMRAATRTHIERLEASLEAEIDRNSVLKEKLEQVKKESAEIRVERDMMHQAALVQVDRQAHWKQIVKVLRWRLSEQAAIIRSIYECDEFGNITTGLLRQEQEEVKRVSRHRWAAEHEVVALRRENEALRQYRFASEGLPVPPSIPIEEAPSDMRVVHGVTGEFYEYTSGPMHTNVCVSGPDSRDELDEGNPDRDGDW